MDPISSGAVVGGDFRIERPLSQGAMGQVYLVTQLSTGSRRALKLMHPLLLAKAELRERFEREARVSAEIASDHVVQVLAAGIDEELSVPWLVMEFLEGRTLDAMLKEQGPPPFDTARILFAQLGHGLTQAHAKGIVHRDLKPENLFVAAPRTTDAPFCLKVLDFGIAKMLGSTTESTAALGTPLYMAPEQTDAGSRIGPHTDVWAAALVAFFTFTGRHYWRSANKPSSGLPALMREVIFDAQDPASQRARELGAGHPLPHGFDHWFARCTSREIEQRPSTAQAFAELDAMLAQPGARAIGMLATEPQRANVAPHPQQTQMSSQNLLPSTQGLHGTPGFPAQSIEPGPRRGWRWLGALLGAFVFGGLVIGGIGLVRLKSRAGNRLRNATSQTSKGQPVALQNAPSSSNTGKRHLKITCEPACSLTVNGTVQQQQAEHTIVLTGKGDLRVVFDLVKTNPRLIINTGVNTKASDLIPGADAMLTCFDSCWLISSDGVGGRGAAYIPTRGRVLNLDVEPQKKREGFPVVTYRLGSK